MAYLEEDFIVDQFSKVSIFAMGRFIVAGAFFLLLVFVVLSVCQFESGGYFTVNEKRFVKQFDLEHSVQ